MKAPQILMTAVIAIAASLLTFTFMNPEDDAGGAKAQGETAYERVMQTGTLRCGYAISPPALVKDPNTGVLSGIDYDIFEAIGKELDLKIEWTEELGWGSFVQDLRNGRVDAFCSQAWQNPARSKFLSMTRPVLYTKMYPYVRPDDNRFDGNLARINQLDVGIPGIDGDVGVHMATSRFPNARVETLPQMATVSDMFLSVTSGKSDVIFLDENFYQVLSKNNEGSLKRVPGIDAVYVYGARYAVKNGEHSLRDMLNLPLQLMIDDGRVAEIASQYGPDYIIPKTGFEE